MRFDHAGVATDDAEGLAFLYEDLFGCEIVHEERFGELRVIFLALENGYFELLEPQGRGRSRGISTSTVPGSTTSPSRRATSRRRSRPPSRRARSVSTRSRDKGRGGIGSRSSTPDRPAAC